MAFESLLSPETALALLAAGILYSTVSNLVLSPLRKVPGPWYCAISGLFYKGLAAKGTHLEWIQGLHEVYGPIVRVAPGVVNVRDVDAAYTLHSTHKYVKGPSYTILEFTGGPNIFSASDPHIAKTRRKLAMPMFTRTALDEMDEMIMSAGVRPLLRRLDRHAKAGDTINLYTLFHYMTFDVIGDIVFGRSFNLMEDDNNGDNIIAWLGGMSQLGIYKYAFGSLANKWLMPSLHECQRKALEFTLEAIHTRQKIKNPRPDSLQRYLTAIKEEKVEHMTEMEIAGDMLMQLVAGSDTTGNSCVWTMYLLSRAPDVYARLVRELQEAIPDGNAEIRHSMVCDLPYLNAVISESLRIYPTGGRGAHRLVPKGGLELCDQYLPEGTIVMATQYMINRCSKIWDEPAAFRPERWLSEDSVRLDEMKRAFFPFSMGVRSCVGRDLAWMELRVTLASVIRRFQVEISPDDDMFPICSLTIQPRGHALTGRLTRRLE